MAAKQSKLEVLQDVWDWAHEKLTTEEINNYYYPQIIGKNCHMAAKAVKHDLLQQIWDGTKKTQTNREFYTLIYISGKRI
jgi:hypothetical protein